MVSFNLGAAEVSRPAPGHCAGVVPHGRALTRPRFRVLRPPADAKNPLFPGALSSKKSPRLECLGLVVTARSEGCASC
jgi:hypothetical protein